MPCWSCDWPCSRMARGQAPEATPASAGVRTTGLLSFMMTLLVLLEWLGTLYEADALVADGMDDA
jgi:hypothetical protein